MSDKVLSFDEEARTLLTQLCETLSAQTGLTLVQAQWIDLQRIIAMIAVELECEDWRSCLKLLLSPEGAVHQQLLIDRFTVGETYFFRDSAFFKLLRETILPEFIQTRRDTSKHLRIWSAGCCSGEEPYSLAIELTRLLPDIKQWRISILATDINRRFLDKAERGIYERWSFRDKISEARPPYFVSLNKNRFEVAPAIRRLVQFAPLNLAAATYPSPLNGTQGVDIILCRHVLMYLQPDCIAAVIARLSQCLVEGGWLITSTVEAALVKRPELIAQRLPDIVLFRKQSTSHLSTSASITPAVMTASMKTNPQAEVSPTRTEIPKVVTTRTSDSIDTPSSQARFATARALADQGLLAQARVECEGAIASDKLNADGYFLYASILLELNDQAAAEQALKRTLYLDSHRAVAHIALATLLMQKSKTPQKSEQAEAIRCWRNAKNVLQGLSAETVVTDSDGMTAAQLLVMVDRMLEGVAYV